MGLVPHRHDQQPKQTPPPPPIFPYPPTLCLSLSLSSHPSAAMKYLNEATYAN